MVFGSLLIYGVWLLVALVLRVAVQYARTGDHGFRLHADRPFTGAWFARLGFVLALLVGGVSPVLVLTDVVDPIAALDRWPLQVLGVGLAVGGVAATFVAQLAMGRSWRVGVDEHERTELVRRWPFTIVRNPIFTTMGCTAVGLALMAPTALALVGLAMLACPSSARCATWRSRTSGRCTERTTSGTWPRSGASGRVWAEIGEPCRADGRSVPFPRWTGPIRGAG